MCSQNSKEDKLELTFSQKISNWWNNGETDHKLALKAFDAIMEWDIGEIEKCKTLGVNFNRKFWYTGKSSDIHFDYRGSERREKLVGRIGNYPVYEYENITTYHQGTKIAYKNKEFLIISKVNNVFCVKYITEESPDDIITFFGGSKTFNGQYTLQDVEDWKYSILPPTPEKTPEEDYSNMEHYFDL